MKHKVIALTAALSMLGGSIAALPAMAAGNIVDNGTFDSNKDGWSGYESSEWVNEYEGRSGVVKVSSRTENGTRSVEQSILGEIDLVPGTEYIVTADIYYVDGSDATNASYNVWLLTSWDAETSNQLAGGWANASVTPNTWTSISTTVTMTNDADALKKGETTARLVIESSAEYRNEYYIDNITLTKVEKDPSDTNVAEVDGVQYTSLDEALSTALAGDTNSATVKLLANAELTTTYPEKTVTIESDNNYTVNVNTTNACTFQNLTLNNVTLTGSSGGKLLANYNLTLTNATISDFENFDCLCLGDFTVTNSKITGASDCVTCIPNNWGKVSVNGLTIENTSNTYWSTLFRVNEPGENVLHTITGLTVTDADDDYDLSIEQENTKLTIKDSKLGAIQNNGKLTLSGETSISSVNMNTETNAVLTLASDFTGSAKITGISTDNGTTVATVDNGANTAGITVDGLANTQELKVDGNKLVIADKPAPASYTTEVGAAEVRKGTGGYADTVATGFQATVTNNGGTQGTFNTVKWDVTLGDETKTTGDQPITNVTLDPNAKATIFLVVNNLGDENATATVEIK